jgi:hypothetical protein
MAITNIALHKKRLRGFLIKVKSKKATSCHSTGLKMLLRILKQ